MMVMWDRIDRETFESLVAVLLSRTFPTCRRMDGSGGDGGRDCFFPGDAGEVIFQIKSFSGRLNASRRNQVRHSLATAARRSPASWALVVPIDQTQSEEAWFQALQPTVPFPIEWLGRTWLDSQIAAHPDIREYFLGDHRDEVLRLLGELQAPQALLSNAADAAPRLRAIYEQLNRIDPFFRYEFAVGASSTADPPRGSFLSVLIDKVRLSLFEQYPGALIDRPIRSQLDISLPAGDSLVAQVQRAFDFGEPLTLPAEAVSRFWLDGPGGLGGELGSGLLSLGPSVIQSNLPAALRATVTDGDRELAELGFVLREGTAGLKGVVLRGADESGALNVQLTAMPDERQLEVSFRFNLMSRLPESLLPLIRWSSLCAPPHGLRLEMQGLPLGQLAVPHTWFDPKVAQLVEGLGKLQRLTGRYFPLPLDLTEGDLIDILEAVTLLQGEVWESTWSTMHFEVGNNGGQILESLLHGEKSVRLTREQWVIVGEHRIGLGLVTLHLHAVVISNLDDVRAAIAAQQRPIVMHLVPGTSDRMDTYRGSQRPTGT